MNDWRRGLKKWRKAKADFSNAQKILDKRESAIEAGIKPVDPADAEDTPTFALSYAHKKQASRSGKISSRTDPELKQKVISMAQKLLDDGKNYINISARIEIKLKDQGIKLSRQTIKKYMDKAVEKNNLKLN